MKRRLKVLIFFFFFLTKRNVGEKKTACMEAKERYILSEVMVSIMYVNF